MGSERQEWCCAACGETFFKPARTPDERGYCSLCSVEDQAARDRDELASLRARLEAAERKAREWQSAAHAAGGRADAAEEELADWRASARKAANEECGDEKHCACVGLLKKTLRESLGHQIDMQSALEEAEQQRDAALRELEKANEKLNSRRCNSGHETLPLVLWDCPECVKLIRDQRDAANALLRDLAPYLKSGDMMPADLFRRLAAYTSDTDARRAQGGDDA